MIEYAEFCALLDESRSLLLSAPCVLSVCVSVCVCVCVCVMCSIFLPLRVFYISDVFCISSTASTANKIK
jgi:hypothetical protein